MPEEQLSPLQRKLAEIDRDSEEREAKHRAERRGVEYADMRKVPVSIEAVKLIPEAQAKEAKVAAIQLGTDQVALAAYNPETPEVKAIAQDLEAKHRKVKFFIVSLSGLKQVWHYYEFIPPEMSKITGKVEIEKAQMEKLRKELTTIDLVHKEVEDMVSGRGRTTEMMEVVLAGAMANRSSDIHFEAEDKGTKLRFRVDGVLHDVVGDLPKKNYESLVSRIKLLSNLKINVHGEPQDGRFTISLGTKEIEVRVSIIPSEFGETIVMRVLDPDAINVTMEQLGLRPDDLAIVEGELKKPNGLILNTGPTGSGKTTTLYTFLRKLVSSEIKVITVEDPIEYRVPGVEQTQVDPEVGYTFAGGLRAIVRQDPDVILIGEIRDKETADIALEAALTGHMVLSTLHTNDAVGAVPRLIDVGVKPESIGPAISLVIAQRLVRILCPTCKKKSEITPEMQKKITGFLARLPKRVDQSPYAAPTIFEPVGCADCNSFGYKGRRGIFEFFRGGPELEQLILKEASEVALRELAKKQEMVFMQEDGILKAISGLTTFAEVESVTSPLVW